MDNNSNNNFNDILSNGEKINDLTNNTKNKNKVSGIWSALFLLCMLAIVGGVAYYLIVILSPKSIMFNSVQKMSLSLEKMVRPLKVDYNPGNKFSSTNSMKINIDGQNIDDIKDLLNNSQINYNIMYDKDNKEMFLDLDSTISDTKFDFDYYVKDKESYLFLYDIYDKFIKLEDIDLDLFSNRMTSDDMNYIFKVFVNSLNTNLDESFLTRNFSISSNPTVTSTLEMTEGNLVNLLNAIRKDLFNDNRINEIFLMYMSQEEIDELKKQEMDVSDTDFDSFKIITTHSLITDNLNRVELVIDKIGESQRYIYENNDGNISFYVYINDEEELKGDIKFNNNNFDLNILDSKKQQSFLSLSGKEDGEYYVYNMKGVSYLKLLNHLMREKNVNTYNDEDYYEMTLKTKFVHDSNLTYNIEFGMKYSDFNFNLIYNGSISPLTSGINKDVSNYVLYDSIDDEEIMNNFQEKFKPLIEKFSNRFDDEDLYNDIYDF